MRVRVEWSGMEGRSESEGGMEWNGGLRLLGTFHIVDEIAECLQSRVVT